MIKKNRPLENSCPRIRIAPEVLYPEWLSWITLHLVSLIRSRYSGDFNDFWDLRFRTEKNHFNPVSLMIFTGTEGHDAGNLKCPGFCPGENIFSREIMPPSCASEWFIRTMRKRRTHQSSSKNTCQVEEPYGSSKTSWVFPCFRSDDLQHSPVSSLMRFDTPGSVRVS
jgi:hypothetical protein